MHCLIFLSYWLLVSQVAEQVAQNAETKEELLI